MRANKKSGGHQKSGAPSATGSTTAEIFWQEKALKACAFRALAEAVGFEPTWRFTVNSISSRARYDHFDTPPWEIYSVFSTDNMFSSHSRYNRFDTSAHCVSIVLPTNAEDIISYFSYFRKLFYSKRQIIPYQARNRKGRQSDRNPAAGHLRRYLAELLW